MIQTSARRQALATWQDLASENRAAASILFEAKNYRSSINRAYFAVYARATHALSTLSIDMPQGREGPKHSKLRPMVEANLVAVQPDRCEALSRNIGELYYLRLRADYAPSDNVDEKDARAALGLMKKTFHML